LKAGTGQLVSEDDAMFKLLLSILVQFQSHKYL